MTLDILRKTGGWCVELQFPLKHHAGEVTAIEIRPATADTLIRWRDEIPSILALMSMQCDLPESVLRQLPAADFDRVMFAFINCMPPTIRTDLEQAVKPLATPLGELMESDRVPAPDQLDPRFPATTGPVQRIPKRPPEPEEDADVPPMNFDAPNTTEAVR